jgi:hypothetical protein
MMPDGQREGGTEGQRDRRTGILPSMKIKRVQWKCSPKERKSEAAEVGPAVVSPCGACLRLESHV